MISSTSAPTDQAAAFWTRGASAAWPENSTYDELLLVASAKMIASTATDTPSAMVRITLRPTRWGWISKASRRMAVPSTAAMSPTAMAHTKTQNVGMLTVGRLGTANE